MVTRGNGPLDLEQHDQVTAQKPPMVKPTLDQLPVYVHGGSILPIAPLTWRSPRRQGAFAGQGARTTADLEAGATYIRASTKPTS